MCVLLLSACSKIKSWLDGGWWSWLSRELATRPAGTPQRDAFTAQVTGALTQLLTYPSTTGSVRSLAACFFVGLLVRICVCIGSTPKTHMQIYTWLYV